MFQTTNQTLSTGHDCDIHFVETVSSSLAI